MIRFERIGCESRVYAYLMGARAGQLSRRQYSKRCPWATSQSSCAWRSGPSFGDEHNCCIASCTWKVQRIPGVTLLARVAPTPNTSAAVGLNTFLLLFWHRGSVSSNWPPEIRSGSRTKCLRLAQRQHTPRPNFPGLAPELADKGTRAENRRDHSACATNYSGRSPIIQAGGAPAGRGETPPSIATIGTRPPPPGGAT